MKKLIALFLVAVMALSLCACGSDNPYPEYDYIDEMLANGDYEGAVLAIYELYQQVNGGDTDNGDNGGNNDNGGNGGDNGGNNDTVATEPPRPTEDEWTVLRRYRELTNELLYFVENGSVSLYDDEDNYLDGSAALGYILSQLQNFDTAVIDKWVGTQYTTTDYIFDRNGNEVNWDIASYLAGFSKLDNVLLEQKRSTLDNMENLSTGSSVEYFYNADGTVQRIYNEDYAFELIETNPWEMSGTREYTYDETGKVTKIRYMSGETVNYIVTLTYDDNGNVINEHIKQNSGEVDITYEYDDQNRVVKIEHPEYIGNSTIITYNYTYDENGNVIKEEKISHNPQYYIYETYHDMVDSKYIREFVYDDNGVLISGSNKYENWEWRSEYHSDTGSWTVIPYIYREQLDQYSFTADSQGRIQTVVVTYGDEVYVSGDNAGQVYDSPNYVSRTFEFVYGDYYFYTSAE